ncbi:hypothetical protein Tco_0047470 [Tanacetum coccineum]
MMDDPNITMEEYIKLQAKKAQRRDYPAIGYDDALTSNENVSPEPTTIADRMRMVYTGAKGQALLTSHAWGRLFEIQGPLVWEFILEFFSTCRISDAELGLDVYILPRRWQSMVLRHIGWAVRERSIIKGILGITRLRFHLIGTFWGPAPSYTFIQDPVRRLCHTLISYSISGRGRAPEKVTATDLFYLRRINQGTVNILYLLA